MRRDTHRFRNHSITEATSTENSRAHHAYLRKFLERYPLTAVRPDAHVAGMMYAVSSPLEADYHVSRLISL